MSGQRPLLQIALTCGAILLGTVIIGAQLSTSRFPSSAAPDHETAAEDRAPRINIVVDDSEQPEAIEDNADASGENGDEDGDHPEQVAVDRQAVIDALTEQGYNVTDEWAAANPDEESEDSSDKDDGAAETSTDQ